MNDAFVIVYLCLYLFMIRLQVRIPKMTKDYHFLTNTTFLHIEIVLSNIALSYHDFFGFEKPSIIENSS